MPGHLGTAARANRWLSHPAQILRHARHAVKPHPGSSFSFLGKIWKLCIKSLFVKALEEVAQGSPPSDRKAGEPPMGISPFLRAVGVLEAEARTDGQLLTQFLAQRDEAAFTAL